MAARIINSLNLKQQENIENLKKEFEHNILEDAFSTIEEKMSVLLKKITQTNTSLHLTLNDYDLLIYFIAFQLAKTKKKLTYISSDDGSDDFSKIMQKFNFTEEEYHTFTLYTVYCVTEAIYLSCLTRLDKINIYYNDSDIKFITSDDPCFNQRAHLKEFFIQFPISPEFLIEVVKNTDENIPEILDYYKYHKDQNYSNSLIVNSKLINFFEIDRESVIEINNKILNAKDKFVYAIDKNDFMAIK